MAGSFPFFLTVFFHLLMMLSCLQYIHVNAGLKVHQLGRLFSQTAVHLSDYSLRSHEEKLELWQKNHCWVNRGRVKQFDAVSIG